MTSGLAGALVLVGLAAVVWGAAGVLQRPRWGRPARRRSRAGAVAVAGLASVLVGAALFAPAGGQPVAAAPVTTAFPDPVSPTPVTPTPRSAPSASATVRPPVSPEPPPAGTEPPASTPTPPGAKRGTALYALAGISVKGRAPKTGYHRDEFGAGWSDTNHNSCSSREDILRRDLRPVTVQAGTGGCEVVAGSLADPYTGTTIAFRKGPTTSDDVQIDHIVSLSDAWQKGAQLWSRSKRIDFANAPLELLATAGSANGAKSDSDSASWLPADKSYRCTFVARQISIKAGFGLWVTAAEKTAMQRVLARCPDQRTISRSAASTPKADSVSVHHPAAEPGPPPPVEGSDDPAVTYRNCDAVRAAGADPIHAGEPGYSRRLDRDGDGVGCER